MKFYTLNNTPDVFAEDWMVRIRVDPGSSKYFAEYIRLGLRGGLPIERDMKVMIDAARIPKKLESVVVVNGIIALREICDAVAEAFPDCVQLVEPIDSPAPFRRYACLGVIKSTQLMDEERSEFIRGEPDGYIRGLFSVWVREDSDWSPGSIAILNQAKEVIVVDEKSKAKLVKCGVPSGYFSDLLFRAYNRSQS